MARPKGAKSNPDRRHLPFKQSEIERAIRGARAQGISVTRIEIEPRAGKIAIVGAEPSSEAVEFEKANPWDKVLEKKK